MITSHQSNSKIARQRLVQQHIAAPDFETPAEVVRWLGAVQAQDYVGSLWAVGLRMHTATEAVVEGNLADRSIVRTWPMRGTLHFVPAENVRWMLRLLTPRVLARSQTRFRRMELDERVFSRSEKALIRALSGGRQLSRPALYKELEAAGIATRNTRGLHIIGKLAQDGLICFGPRQGKQQTFVLLEEWLPAVKPKERDEALAELAKRYFVGHGPATLQDFAWWSGLSSSDARAGLEMAKPWLVSETID